jgi:hypothetical protein
MDEMLAGTDKDDPCDPNLECAACLAIRPPTPTPVVTPSVPPAVTPTPSPTPKPPGFEAVFANFFASQKPLLKMLRNCRHVSNRILSAEKEKVNQKPKKKK